MRLFISLLFLILMSSCENDQRERRPNCDELVGIELSEIPRADPRNLSPHISEFAPTFNKKDSIALVNYTGKAHLFCEEKSMFKDGIWYTSYNNTTTAEFKNGKLHGVVKIYSSKPNPIRGDLRRFLNPRIKKQEDFYKNGKLIISKIYHPNGKPKTSKKYYNDDAKLCRIKTWYENGILSSNVVFLKSKQKKYRRRPKITEEAYWDESGKEINKDEYFNIRYRIVEENESFKEYVNIFYWFVLISLFISAIVLTRWYIKKMRKKSN